MTLVLIFRVNNVTKQLGILRLQLNESSTKQPKFRDATVCLPREMTSEERLGEFYNDDFLVTCHYPDLGSAFDWPKQITLAARPIRSTTQTFWLVTDTFPVLNFCVRFSDVISQGMAS